MFFIRESNFGSVLERAVLIACVDACALRKRYQPFATCFAGGADTTDIS